ncbi:MAG: TVP38/TMEM64 family protein [Reyranella sp.]|nr:TVP38/TMEM64 family protein [Reyranella sp.]
MTTLRKDGGEGAAVSGKARVFLRWFAVIGALALLVGGTVLGGWHVIEAELFGNNLQAAIVAATNYIRSWGMLAVVASIGLMVMHSFVPVPAEILAVANCMVFGPYWGFIVTWIGAMVAATLSFGLSRYFGRPLLKRLFSARVYAKVDEWSVHQGAPALIVGRLIPLVSFNVINYAAGVTAVSWWTFIWTTSVGILPATVVTVLVTESLLSGDIGIVLLCSGAGLLLLMVWALRRWVVRSRGF